jgi:ElaA protein
MSSIPSDLTWLDCNFDDLSVRHVHSLLKLRQQIFIIEQTCIFPDIDGLDPLCRHVIACDGDEVLAAARIVAPGIDPDHAAQGDRPAIGRVVASQRVRGLGIGREVMRRAIKVCAERFVGKPIYLNGQLYLRSFYESLGFVQFGDEYDEDGIAHISMERPADVR